MQGMYQRWGFTGNPFTQQALGANERGKKLLVGRRKEVETVIGRLLDPPKAVTIEGANGVGKTSIINVAVYTARELFHEQEMESLFIPAASPLQLSSEGTEEDFLDRMYYAVAQALLGLVEDGRVGKRPASLKHEAAIKKWMNRPEIKGWQGGIPTFNFGVSPTQNTTPGFTRDGFRALVREWLDDMFSGGETGGVVCLLDNLEILQTSKAARVKLEALRDPALGLAGLRWVLCGAAGIVRSVASTPRLEGLLYTPVEVEGIGLDYAQEVLRSRIAVFGEVDNPFLPIDEAAFARLCEILNGNIRNALSYSDNYCRWVAENEREPDAALDSRGVFVEWLKFEHERIMEDVNKQVTPRAWQAFDKAVELGGTFAPGDYGAFDCNSSQALRGILVALERAGLIKSVVDEDDSRRRTISLTPRGWMVHHARAQGFDTLFEAG